MLFYTHIRNLNCTYERERGCNGEQYKHKVNGMGLESRDFRICTFRNFVLHESKNETVQIIVDF